MAAIRLRSRPVTVTAGCGGPMKEEAMGWRRLTAPLTASIVRRSFRADLAKLKDILEAEA
jgi:hypothetical protein